MLLSFQDEKLYKMARLLAVDPTYKQKNEQYVAEDLSFLSDFELHKICTEHKVFNMLILMLPVIVIVLLKVLHFIMFII